MILPFFAKCSDGGVAPAVVIARGWKRTPPAVPYFVIAANLNDCVYALMRESRKTFWQFDVIAAGRLVVVDGHDDSCLAPRSKIRSS